MIPPLVSGARLHANYIRPGGVSWDLNYELLDDIYFIIYFFSTHLQEIENILHFNRIWRQRLVDIGVVFINNAFHWAFSGPMLRGSGINWDLRKVGFLETFYRNFKFKIPLGLKGDCYDRFLIRIEEMRESVFVLEQALKNLPAGQTLSDNLKVVGPTRWDMRSSMESLIHHFKLHTEGFTIAKNLMYFAYEAPKGEFVSL